MKKELQITYEEFSQKLKELKLSKKEFSELTGCAYSTIMSWGADIPVPKWVKNFLYFYELAQKYLIIREKML